MAEILKGIEVANAMKEKLIRKREDMVAAGVTPCLAIVRVGESPDDLYYEEGVLKRFAAIGIEVEVNAFPEDISQEAFEQEFKSINDDDNVHGILLFLPLPKTLDEDAIKKIINPDKDIDCMCSENFAKVFSGGKGGYAPCTPRGVIELLKHFDVPLRGSDVVLVGRSMVVGKPLAMLMLEENATVTICHAKTKNLSAICHRADIVLAAVGRPKMITKEFIKQGAVVIDIGINIDENGKLCGDVDFDEVSEIASKITPVPGGVGTVTTSILAMHTLKATQKFIDKKRRNT